QRARTAGIVEWIGLLAGENHLRIDLTRVYAEACPSQPISQQSSGASGIGRRPARTSKDPERGVGCVAGSFGIGRRLDVRLEAAVGGRAAALAGNLRLRLHVEISDAEDTMSVRRRVDRAAVGAV